MREESYIQLPRAWAQIFLQLREAPTVYLLFTDRGVSIAHLGLPHVVLRAVPQLGLERLHAAPHSTASVEERTMWRRLRRQHDVCYGQQHTRTTR